MCSSMGLANRYVNAEREAGMRGMNRSDPFTLAQVKTMARRTHKTLDIRALCHAEIHAGRSPREIWYRRTVRCLAPLITI